MFTRSGFLLLSTVSIPQGFFLFCAALLAGALNSVAGGGGFIAFPALIFTGMPPINANATNTAALWPGTVASTGAYRGQLRGDVRRLLAPLTITGLIGGVLGAIILLKTPQTTFMRLVPWFLLLGTLLLTFSRPLTGWLQSRTGRLADTRTGMVGAAAIQLLIALYIGYFGAGAGILMMGVFALMGVQNIHTLNGMKTLLASICNGMALLTFIVAGAIVWPQAVLMILGASLGGYYGAYFAQKMKPERVRAFAIGVGFVMAAYFFIRPAPPQKEIPQPAAIVQPARAAER